MHDIHSLTEGSLKGVKGEAFLPQFEYATAAKGVKPTDVYIDPTNLTDAQKKQLDDLIEAANGKPLTPLEVLQNEVKNLTDRIQKLEERLQVLEYLKNFDSKLRRDWIQEYPLEPRYIEPNTGGLPMQQPFTLMNSVSLDD